MDQAQPVGRIDVISDAICPWCYIGKRQLERALDLLASKHCAVTVAWHPFQLNPEMPPEGVERKQYRIAKFGSLERSQQLDQRITETAATVGLEFHLDRITRTPNTVNAHRLIRFAGQKGVQDAVVEALFEGYFCNGADIGDSQVLARIGTEGGLDRDEVLTMLALVALVALSREGVSTSNCRAMSCSPAPCRPRKWRRISPAPGKS